MTTLLSAAGGAGRILRSASRIVSKAATGFHLLRVEAYLQTKVIPSGQSLDSAPFSIGGRQWGIKYYPNGCDSSTNADYISLYLELQQDYRRLQAQYTMSILDQAGNLAYGLPAKTGVFNGDDEAKLCGHEHFIRGKDLEMRGDLLKDNCVVFWCDVGSFMELNTLTLARYDSHDDGAATDDEDGYVLKRREHYDNRPRHLIPDDKEFVKWCLAQKRMG